MGNQNRHELDYWEWLAEEWKKSPHDMHPEAYDRMVEFQNDINDCQEIENE